MRGARWGGHNGGRPCCGEVGMMGGGQWQWGEEAAKSMTQGRGRGMGFVMGMDQFILELGLALGGVGFQNSGLIGG